MGYHTPLGRQAAASNGAESDKHPGNNSQHKPKNNNIGHRVVVVYRERGDGDDGSLSDRRDFPLGG